MRRAVRMANLELPRRKKSPGEWAMLEARARAEDDRLQEQTAVLAAELSQTGPSFAWFRNGNNRSARLYGPRR
jgi:hypothetical protein